MINKQKLTSYISFSAVPLSIFWLILESGIEPIIVGLYGINSIIGQGFPWNTKKYASLRNKGTVSFNFNKNCNEYEFGKDNVFLRPSGHQLQILPFMPMLELPQFKQLRLYLIKLI
ncbi:hypothetical protein H4Q82_02605 [Pectobacterium carotovorum subsp. carotovorum]|uniref:hypothetical protein n=1 Tax=Pectobacterium TaxID=122277 RepID=UPI001603718E|nr:MULTISPECIES: hypothetical protein [Pectobacterium]MBB1525388.1 hypothetical protein [Pectobacterium carotovorum subsp. carotovorum]MBQ4761977.1 hypothetical protein [Pectobacterium versatile]